MRTMDQIRQISAREKELLLSAKGEIRKSLPDAEVFLYGSVARGTHGPDSDYDILVLTKTPMATQGEDRIRDAVYDLQLAAGKVVSIAFYTRAFWEKHPRMPFRQEVDRDAVAI